MVGFDGNFGQGPDDLRFGFGMRFDVAKLIHRLKLQALFEEEASPTPIQTANGRLHVSERAAGRPLFNGADLD
jgi:hypothetical protein